MAKTKRSEAFTALLSCFVLLFKLGVGEGQDSFVVRVSMQLQEVESIEQNIHLLLSTPNYDPSNVQVTNTDVHNQGVKTLKSFPLGTGVACFGGISTYDSDNRLLYECTYALVTKDSEGGDKRCAFASRPARMRKLLNFPSAVYTFVMQSGSCGLYVNQNLDCA